jgi:hypothetical protein
MQDLTQYLSYRNNTELMRYQGKRAPMSDEEGRAFLDEMANAKLGSGKKGVQIAISLAADNSVLVC